ncbi:hypothetical protein ACFQZZ_25410 [Nocardia sp. GCM10030253]|uniref:hypothetical protein n=1 Tax=Nocardia sp. GCM10030253 TaxID=3273404 RepID=UPI00363DC94E
MPTRAAVQKLESRSDELIGRLASRLHETWRLTKIRPNGTYKPRPKPTEDPEWIARHGTNQADISNTPFEELPRDLQWDNQESARVAVELVLSELRAGRDPGRHDFIEEASSKIHDEWLIRNRRTATDEQQTSYADLPEEQKQLDRDVFHAGLNLIAEELRGK